MIVKSVEVKLDRSNTKIPIQGGTSDACVKLPYLRFDFINSELDCPRPTRSFRFRIKGVDESCVSSDKEYELFPTLEKLECDASYNWQPLELTRELAEFAKRTFEDLFLRKPKLVLTVPVTALEQKIRLCGKQRETLAKQVFSQRDLDTQQEIFDDLVERISKHPSGFECRSDDLPDHLNMQIVTAFQEAGYKINYYREEELVFWKASNPLL